MMSEHVVMAMDIFSKTIVRWLFFFLKYSTFWPPFYILVLGIPFFHSFTFHVSFELWYFFSIWTFLSLFCLVFYISFIIGHFFNFFSIFFFNSFSFFFNSFSFFFNYLFFFNQGLWISSKLFTKIETIQWLPKCCQLQSCL